MKKTFFIFYFLFFLSSVTWASESYNSLWKRVSEAEQKDLPRDQIRLMEKICSKAETEAEWGQFMKAELRIIDVWSQISPDSLKPQLSAFCQKVEKMPEGSVSTSVYNTVLGCIYRDYYNCLDMKADSAALCAKKCFEMALMDPQLLADTKAKGYEPFVVQGDASSVFGNDLLHVLGIEAENYQLLSRWYKAHDNRAAACLSDFMQTQKDRREDVKEIRRSFYMHTLDSLIDEYSDLPEAGEIAIERFTYMDQATDASANEKVDYIDEALRRWPTWRRIAVLQNAKTRIQLPSFHVQLQNTNFIPYQPQKVMVTALKNIGSLRMTVTKVNMSGAEEFDPKNESDLKMIRNLLAKEPSCQDVRTYYGLPAYLEMRDTLTIDSLCEGVYLAEFSTDNSSIPVERILLHVSNLRLVDMDMPGKRVRLIVCDATTGKPVANANVDLRFSFWNNGKQSYENKTLVSNPDGEVSFTSNGNPISYRVTLGQDNAMKWQNMGTSWKFTVSEEQKAKNMFRTDVFTDRAIYRPGQQVSVAVIANSYNRLDSCKVLPGEQLRIVLSNDGKALDTVFVRTDEWGVATAAFPLPETIKTGYCQMRVTGVGNDQLQAWKTVRVEEYKKPTFTAYIDKFTDSYAVGDTITLCGHAKTFTGVALQYAMVTYTVNRVSQNDTIRTDQNGDFHLRVPMTMSDKNKPFGRRRAYVSVSAKVTSIAGETHEASLSVPLADKPLMVEVKGLGDKVCLEHLPDVKVWAINPAGQETKDSVTVTGLVFTPGKHTMTAYCKGDTIKKDFIVFSLKDERPQVDTKDWFYIDGTDFSKGDIHMQVGTTEKQQTIYYAIVSEKGIMEEGRFMLDNNNQNRTFSYREEWGDGLALRYSWVRDGRIYTHSASLLKPAEPKDLQLEWKTFRDHTQPGAKESWTLIVKSPLASWRGAGSEATHLIATLYDKSLDEIVKHSWSLNHYSLLSPPQIFASLQNSRSEAFIFGEETYRPLIEPQQDYSHLDIPYFSSSYGMMLSDSFRPMRTMKASSDMMVTDAAPEANANVRTQDFSTSQVQELSVSTLDQTTDSPDLRTELTDEAFFMPSLVSNDKGEVSLNFQLPENLTTWRFMGLAHDKQMHSGTIDADVVVQKPLMVQPNMPRFLREGDKAEISAMVSNTTDKALGGSATLTVVDESTGKTVFKQKRQFMMGADSQTSVSFNLSTNTQHLTPDTYICRITASAGKYSDGEQDRLCVVSNKERVVTTCAFTQTEPGVKTVSITALTGKNATDVTTEIKYTDNPALLMMDALGNMEETDRDDAVSLATAIFAGTVKEKLNTDPSKAINPLPMGEGLGERLSSLQNPDGSFSWCPRMMPSEYITEAVTKILLRAQKISPSETCKLITDKSMQWLDGEMNERIAKLKNEKSLIPNTSSLIPYLYLQTLQGTLSKTGKENAKYCLKKLSACSFQLSIYEKAQMATILARHPEAGNMDKALEQIESIKQYAVSTPEMGTYFDTPKAGYSWCDYKIPTQTAVVEALQCMEETQKLRNSETQKLITSMRLWLLQEKRTQQWSTPLNSASAVYAFFGGDSKDKTQPVENTIIKVDGKKVSRDGISKDKGLFDETYSGTRKKIDFVKSSANISWGAVLVNALQPIEDVVPQGDGLTVKREYIDEKGNLTSLDQLKVGDKVKVRITVESQRDLDFVEISDHRAACLEPASQLSGYHWGYYSSAKDKETVYYIQKLSKGRHEYVSDYYVDRQGTYQPGIVMVKCAYAPEYCAYSK